MTRTSNNSIRQAITPSNVYSVLTSNVFRNFKVRVSKSGSIKIELEPSKCHKNGWVSKPVEYTIGYGDSIGYWLRRQNRCGHTFPLHYNRNTGEYGFKTFEEAAAHLEKLFINKYFYINPVEE